MSVQQDLYIQVTKDCNQECIFCTQPKVDIYLPFSRIKEMAQEWKKSGGNSIVLTGGEPTLHPEIVEIAKYFDEEGFTQRMITNGSRLSDNGLCKRLLEAGLRKYHFSIHSHKEDVAESISKTRNLKDALKGVRNMIDLGAEVCINLTIIKNNYPHLSEYFRFMRSNFPEVHHFVLNFVEIGGRAAENKQIIPKLSDVELELSRALSFLREEGCTMRVERVPLCYMADNEIYSSETRRILGNQEYHSYLISEDYTQVTGKDTIYSIGYIKGEDCGKCWLSGMCVGVKKSYHELFGTDELYPLFKPIRPFIDMNLSD